VIADTRTETESQTAHVAHASLEVIVQVARNVSYRVDEWTNARSGRSSMQEDCQASEGAVGTMHCTGERTDKAERARVS